MRAAVSLHTYAPEFSFVLRGVIYLGDRFRRILRVLLKTAFQSALPGIIIYIILLLSFVLRGTPHDVSFAPRTYLTLILTCYLTAFCGTCFLELREFGRAAVRTDSRLIGKHFSGLRKKDRLFCDALELLKSKKVRSALELLLQVRDASLSAGERGVCSFYIAQCYQMLSCHSNALSYYDTALENGFSRPHALLYQARCYAESGDFDRSYALFQELLQSDPPKEFFFLYTDIGFLYLRQCQPEQAEEWFRRSIAEHLNYAFALSGMAIAALQRGDFAAAHSGAITTRPSA